MKVLITGGAGFVGSHVVDSMIAAGHEPRIFDLAPSQWHCPDEVDTYVHAGILATLRLDPAELSPSPS